MKKDIDILWILCYYSFTTNNVILNKLKEGY